MKPDKEWQQSYRRRMLEHGYRQFAFWLDSDTQAALKRLKTSDTDLSTVVSKAIKHYQASMLKKAVSSNVASDAKPVTSNVSSDSDPVSSHVSSNATSNVTSNRYMTPALEDRILALRQAGATLKETASRLANEGSLNANGRPYSTGTISKAEQRARVRTSTS